MTNDVLQDSTLSRLVEAALMGDIGAGDLTSDAIFGDDDRSRAVIVAKQSGIVAGFDVAAMVFEMSGIDGRMVLHARDGDQVNEGKVLSEIVGRTKGILRGERIALNFLQRMSGIATMTRTFVDAVAGTRAKITDTRKTAPGLRALDKRAVSLGGGINHRFGLDDMILIKDNHIAAAGGIQTAVERCRVHMLSRNIKANIEVETTNLAEVEEALTCTGFRRIMLDNFSPGEMRKAVEAIAGRVEVEASGGIRLENVRAYAETGVDFISIGALTHSVRAFDLSLELTPDNGLPTSG